jgi:hypothetical protein
MIVPAPFLFRPDHVTERLVTLPALAAHLHPAKEGKESAAFESWRISARQIFKPLANVEGAYGFDDLLERVDHWLARGFGGKALRARDRATFRAALSELHVADHFEACGFDVRGLDQGKGQERIGDMRIERDGLSATVEVYSPVEWEGLEYFEFDSWDALRQLDIPYDYRFDFNASINAFPSPHPEEVAHALDTLAKRQRILGPFFNAVVSKLGQGGDHLLVEQHEGELDISLRVELEHIRPLRGFKPRGGVQSPLSVGGYRPELIFRDVIVRALAKAREGQARTGDGVGVFIVNVSRLPLDSEFGHEAYQKLFREILGELLPDDAALPVDVFAVCSSLGWRSRLSVLYAAWETDNLSRNQCETMLGPLSGVG